MKSCRCTSNAEHTYLIFIQTQYETVRHYFSNGDILKVGGIKEKIIGAFNHQIKEVFIPDANALDLEEIPEDIKNKMTIHLVKNYQEIYDLLFNESKK